MATFYIDPTVAGPGTGTLANPFRSWTSVRWAAGNTYLQKRGTTYSGVLKVGASGTATARITIGSYYRADGTDDPTRPRPVIILPSAPVTPADGGSIAVFRQERDYITYRNLDIRNTALPEAGNVAIIWLGNNCVFDNNLVASNCGGIYVFDKNHVTISNCTLNVLSGSLGYANQGIAVAGSANVDDIQLLGNVIHHGGGGTTASHGIRCETYSNTGSLTRFVIRGNRVSPPPGQQYSNNQGAIGIYLVNGLAARLERNTVTGMLTGLLLNGGSRSYLGNNSCSTNMNFGIHITGLAKSFVIEANTCNYNGGPLSPNYYGRGIELSSAAGPNAVTGHTIRRNTCRFNYNYGGPFDNGSEGVGIGLDDGTTKCSVYANNISDNEGNGIQLYGGGNPAKYPDTGGNMIMSNTMAANCTYSVMNRRDGGTEPSPFYAHIQLAYIYGSPTVISNNMFIGPTQGGARQDVTCSNVVVINNIYVGVPYPLRAEEGSPEQV